MFQQYFPNGQFASIQVAYFLDFSFLPWLFSSSPFFPAVLLPFQPSLQTAQGNLKTCMLLQLRPGWRQFTPRIFCHFVGTRKPI